MLKEETALAYVKTLDEASQRYEAQRQVCIYTLFVHKDIQAHYAVVIASFAWRNPRQMLLADASYEHTEQTT